MNDLSVRGIARRYLNTTGAVSVRRLLRVGASERVALRARLASAAREEHSFDRSECVYGWTARFEQAWTHVKVRIRLNPDANVSDQTIADLRQTWKAQIEDAWSNRFGCSRAGELTCPLTFEVTFVRRGEHHVVRVSPGPGRSNMGRWYTTVGICAAHEYGHMLGLVDEYSDPVCPDRDPVNTGNIMDDCAGIIARLMRRFASNIGSQLVDV